MNGAKEYYNTFYRVGIKGRYGFEWITPDFIRNGQHLFMRSKEINNETAEEKCILDIFHFEKEKKPMPTTRLYSYSQHIYGKISEDSCGFLTDSKENTVVSELLCNLLKGNEELIREQELYEKEHSDLIKKKRKRILKKMEQILGEKLD